MMTEMSIENAKLVYSYAPEDKRFQEQLAKHLSILEKQQRIISWDYSKIVPGQNLTEEINRKLNEADIILLLISHHFIASSDCYDIEMKRAIERQKVDGIRVIPILLSPVVIEDAPFSKLSALPTNNNPITNWSKPQKAFVDIAKGIREAVEEICNNKGKNESTISPIMQRISNDNPIPDKVRQAPTIQLPSPKHIIVSKNPNKPIELLSQNGPHYKVTHLPKLWQLVSVGIIIVIIAFLALFPYMASFRSMGLRWLTANNENTDKTPLEVSLETIHSQLWVIPGNVAQYSLNKLPQDIGAVYTDGHISAPFYYLYFGLHNSSQGHSNIVIEGIKLLIQEVRTMPHPISIWKNDITDDLGSKYKYEALYLGETEGSIQAEYVNSDYVTHSFGSLILPPGSEQDGIEIHIISRQEADVLFKVQITYSFGNETEQRIDNIKELFEVVFVNKIDQHSYQLESGHFVLVP